jgi:hypothetical protein
LTPLAVYTGTSVSNLTNIASDEDNGGFHQPLSSTRPTVSPTARHRRIGGAGHFLLRDLEQNQCHRTCDRPPSG